MAVLVSSSSRLALKQSLIEPLQVRQSPSLGFPQIRVAPIGIECSSRPQKKATAHHIKSRPKKKGYDRRRKGPTRYPPLSERPAIWDILTPKSWALRALGVDDHPSVRKSTTAAASDSKEPATVEVEVVSSSTE
ncbi:50S ribosomal protein 6, chloroplastic [Selaginella moellendorffii]|nr:50S ribosomal protein 6, chloroplastic [Selaginella moellendorffii]|eukprot:XP_024530790.1 50S ribosomal protein 6, chloroplastic [Selaginella moellendorffii]